MSVLAYVEISNLKSVGERVRVDLEHPQVLIGPNNGGKTTVLQAISLWSFAVRRWIDRKGDDPPRVRPSTSITRQELLSIPVAKMQLLWRDAVVRRARKEVKVTVSVGLRDGGAVHPVTMSFQAKGDDIMYCRPDEDTRRQIDLIRKASRIPIHMVSSTSGLDAEEPVYSQKRVQALLGRGQSGQILRNLCLSLYLDDTAAWRVVVARMNRLFAIDFSDPVETPLATISVMYRQDGAKRDFDLAQSGYGVQQTLLMLVFLYSHEDAVLLIDEPDAHLEWVRQAQIYSMLRTVAEERGCQVVLATHSEVVLDRALDHQLAFVIDGGAENYSNDYEGGTPENGSTGQTEMRRIVATALREYGTRDYFDARQFGYVLYLEGTTDLDILTEFAKLLEHNVHHGLDHVNVHYTGARAAESDGIEADLLVTEGRGSRGMRRHFSEMKRLLPQLTGLAILDRDAKDRGDENKPDGLDLAYWDRYEIENYFVTPQVLIDYTMSHYGSANDTEGIKKTCWDVLDMLIFETIFDRADDKMSIWREGREEVRRAMWELATKDRKVSKFASQYFAQLAKALNDVPILSKGSFYQLVTWVDPSHIPQEVVEKLDLIDEFLSTESTVGPSKA